MPTRLTSNMLKLDAMLDITWLAMNRMNTKVNSLRRSMLRVISIIGSEVRDTIHAYTVSIRPTCAEVMSKLWPIALNSPTGTNSVVLKIKAARASAITLSQLPVRASVVFIKGRISLKVKIRTARAVELTYKSPTSKNAARGLRPVRCMQSAEYYEYGRVRPDEAESTPLLTLSQPVPHASNRLMRRR